MKNRVASVSILPHQFLLEAGGRAAGSAITNYTFPTRENDDRPRWDDATVSVRFGGQSRSTSGARLRNETERAFDQSETLTPIREIAASPLTDGFNSRRAERTAQTSKAYLGSDEGKRRRLVNGRVANYMRRFPLSDDSASINYLHSFRLITDTGGNSHRPA